MEPAGPDKKQLANILQAGARAPDTWQALSLALRRLLKAKDISAAGDILAEAAKADGERDKQVEEERNRFLRAPVVIGVISSAREQHQDSGAGNRNCRPARSARTSWSQPPSMGFVGQWVSGWYAYHPVVKDRLGLKAGERVAGFIYIGTSKETLEERPRPDPNKIVGRFSSAGGTLGNAQKLVVSAGSTAIAGGPCNRQWPPACWRRGRRCPSAAGKKWRKDWPA